MRVLLIEDHDGDADLVAEALSEAPSGGVELERVTTLRSGLAALSKPECGRFDVVLLDLSLPDATGLDGLVRLRASAPVIPIVVLTGLVDATAGMNAIRHGAQDFLEKGNVPGRELLRAIRYARERAQVADRERVLSDATVAIGSAATAEGILAALRESLVPGFAQWCTWSGADLPERAVDFAQSGSLAAQSRAASGRLFASFDDVPEAERAQMDELSASGFISAIVVHYHAHGWSHGELTLARTRGAEAYKSSDLQLANEIARRLAAALDHLGLLEVALRERERADVACRARDEFLATLSHELRTPLNAILGWAVMLRRGGVTAEKQAKGLETIERNARCQVALIEDVLEVSRIITGKIRLQVETVDLATIISSALESLSPAAEAKGVSLEIAALDVVGTLQADASRFLQILWNLVSNAVKFTPSGGRVTIRAERVDTWVNLVVADNGVGIAEDLIPHVFERFRQGDSTSTRRHGGLGLGLAITRHLVELHGGNIRAESPGLGFGSTFTVSFPTGPRRHASDDGEQAAPMTFATPQMNASRALHGLRLLVVDDDRDTRDLVITFLEAVGATATCASSAREALALLCAQRPDVLVSDIGMPEANGYQLIEWVRQLAPTAGGATPSLAMTAYARPEDRDLALSSGFDLHVSKPVEPEHLVASILRLTGRARATA